MRNGKNFFIWLAIMVVVVVGYDLIQGTPMGGVSNEVAFSEFLNDVSAKKVKEVKLRGPFITGKYEDGTEFTTYNPNYSGLVDKLSENNVRIDAGPVETGMNSFVGILISWFPVLLLIGVWIFFMRQMQGANGGRGGAMGFGRSRARLIGAEKIKKITFKDVAGINEAKEELFEIVDFLKNPEKFKALGGKIPKGCLLIGSPGTGKTLLAKAIAGEAEVPFFTISGSDFVEMFVGVGASRVRDLFEQGKKSAPCLIFIDEIDAVGRHRGAGVGGGNDEREQTLNQMLVEMDGFEENEGVIILAATNRPDVLDPALLRPGRFDRQIVVPLPDILGREQILNVHIQKVPLAPDVETRIIARGTPGFTGADLANLVNEAALLAARRDRKVISMKELEEAKDKVMMGAERKSMVVSEEEKKLTAYHEAGHAVVSINCKASDPIHKATIIPRGRALGMVMRLPEKDKLSLTRGKAKADMAVAMGGRVAEEMIFGHDMVTSGASSDIKMATNLARAMVTQWGMSDKLGPLDYTTEHDSGHIMAQKNISDTTANTIDSEIKKLVEEGYKLAEEILKTHNDQLEIIAQALLMYETLTGDEIRDIVAGKEIRKASEFKNHKPFRTSSVPTISEGHDKAPKKHKKKDEEKEEA